MTNIKKTAAIPQIIGVLAALILIVMVALTSTGCSTASAEAPTHFYAVGLDKSGSTKEIQTAVYKDYDWRLINSIPDGSTVVTAIVGRDPLSGGRQDQFKVELPAKSFSDIQWRFDEKLNAEKDKLRTKSAELFDNTPVSNRTDILDTIRLLADALPQDRTISIELVLFTDGMETGRLDFYSLELTDQKIAEVIQAEKDSGRLPDLKGVKVKMIGAGKGNNSVAVEVRDRVKVFWTKYYEACGGATLVEYAPTPLSF